MSNKNKEINKEMNKEFFNIAESVFGKEFTEDLKKSFVSNDEEKYFTRMKVNTEGNLEIDVPGFEKNQLSIKYADSILTIEGETKNRKIKEKYNIKNKKPVGSTLNLGILTVELEDDITIQEIKID